MTRTAFVPVAAFLVSAALLLTGCGGSGGAAGAAPSPADATPRPSAAMLTGAAATNMISSVADAAVATPKSGSVTQTSNVDGDGVTVDSISISATYGASGNSYVVSDGTTTIRSSDNGVPILGGQAMSKKVAGGQVYVDAYSDIESSTDTDYLAGGIWVFVPDDATSIEDFTVGVFADGSDPFTQGNLAALTGTATYEGEAAGIYTATVPGTETSVGLLSAQVVLNADFGDGTALGTINGSVSSILSDGHSLSGSLNLGSADIGSASSGFFTGSLSGSVEGESYTGKWGGQFFGNGGGNPGSVAGTLGGTSDSGYINFIGIFNTFRK